LLASSRTCRSACTWVTWTPSVTGELPAIVCFCCYGPTRVDGQMLCHTA
jgi:hypothetical protein